MFRVHSDSVEPKVLQVFRHCYAAINIFIEIFNVLITFFLMHKSGNKVFIMYWAGTIKTSEKDHCIIWIYIYILHLYI